MRLVPIECVKEGSYLAKTIFDDNGRILLREGVELNDRYLKKIKGINIFSVYINDEYSDIVIEDVIKPEIRQKAVAKLKETFISLEKYNIGINTSKIKNQFLKERECYFNSISEVAKQIMDELEGKKNILINLVDIKSLDNYTYQHCVNVAVLSLILGIQLQLKSSELYKLCVGALLHDVGKMFIPKDILNKPGKLSKEEFDDVKLHCSKGYDYLKGSIDISPVSRIIVLQHHEKVDGSGYPNGKKGDEINKLARIVAIADVYDALVSDRPYKRAISPNEAFEYILGSGGTQFDYKMVKAFAEVIVPYPQGSLVKLSNDDVAVVEGFNPRFPLRPKIKIVKSNDDKLLEKKLNLMEKLNLVIKGVVYSIDGEEDN